MNKISVALDAKARRAARRVGLYAKKTRYRNGSGDNRGRFMLLDPHRNTPVAGERFDLDPEEVIAICASYQLDAHPALIGKDKSDLA